MSFTDPDLEYLVADTSVTHTPAPRRTGRGVRTQGNDQGRLDDSLTVKGRQIIVLSDKEDGIGIPLEVNVQGHENNSEGRLGYNGNTAIQALNEKWFKIFIVPSLDETFGTFCFQ
jgi:hypothetical protein